MFLKNKLFLKTVVVIFVILLIFFFDNLIQFYGNALVLKFTIIGIVSVTIFFYEKIIKILNNSRDFLETLSFLSAIIASVFLTTAGIIVSINANKIAQEQIVISNAENMPKFNISSESGKSFYDENGNERGIQIVIKNNGDQISEAYMSANTYIEFELWDKDSKKGYLKAGGKLYGAYDLAEAPYDGNTDSFTLRKNFTNELNNNLISLSYHTIFNDEKYPKLKFKTSPSVVDYVNISYKDFRSDFHNDVYDVLYQKTTLTKTIEVESKYDFYVIFEGVDINKENISDEDLIQSILDAIYEGYNTYKHN